MWGAASILFWCAAVCRPQAWSARCPGTLVWARLWPRPPRERLGALGRAVCRSSRIPPPCVAVPSGGGGAPPRLRGGGGSLLWFPSWGGGRHPAPPLRRAPPGYTLAVGVAGQPRASGAPWLAANGSVWLEGGGEGGGTPPPWFAPPSSQGRHLTGPLRLRRPGRRRSAVGRQQAGRAGACLGCGAAAPSVQRPLQGGCGAAVSSACLRLLLGLSGRGGGNGGALWSPGAAS